MDAVSALQRFGSGRLLQEVYDALVKTAGEVVETGNPGTVTLSLKVSTQHQGDVVVIVEEAVKRTSPKSNAHGAIFYAVDDDLHTEDPRQIRMQFRDVRTVDRDTGEIREPVTDSVERTI